MVGHPGGGFDVAQPPVTPSGQGVGRIAFAVEDHNACTGWNKWRFPEIGGPRRNAVVLEARAPVLGPIGKFALPMQKIRQVGLLVAELLTDFREVGAPRVELGTSSLSATRSNQLSYAPECFVWPYSKRF